MFTMEDLHMLTKILFQEAMNILFVNLLIFLLRKRILINQRTIHFSPNKKDVNNNVPDGSFVLKNSNKTCSRAVMFSVSEQQKSKN